MQGGLKWKEYVLECNCDHESTKEEVCAMKMTVKEMVEKKMNKMALKMAENSLASTCTWVIHQPKLSKEVKDALKC